MTWTYDFQRPVGYAEGVRLQEALVEARIAGRIPDVVLFLEHRPVITLGLRAARDHLLLTERELAARGIEVAATSRGGDVTWHGPGQWVMYPILKLGANEADAHGYLRHLETIALRTAADFGVAAYGRPGLTGAWTAAGKLAAIGIRFKRWVTFHGLSVNVNCALTGFDTIVPCGLHGEPVTSLAALLGAQCPSMDAVRDRMAFHFAAVCRRPLQRYTPDAAPENLVKILGDAGL